MHLFYWYNRAVQMPFLYYVSKNIFMYASCVPWREYEHIDKSLWPTTYRCRVNKKKPSTQPLMPL